jgi:hypothetical protein
MHELAIRDFLQKRLNPQKPKEYRIHIMPQTKQQTTSSSLVTETKTPRDIVHDEQPSNLCDSANFL